MRTPSRPLIALSTMALASAGLALGAGSASADLTTQCDGDASDVTVPGDLVVRSGDACVLDGVTIEGEVRVQAGADLVMSDSSVAERVVVAPDAYLDASDSEVGGNVISRSGYGVYLEDSSVGGAFQGRLVEDDATPFLYSYDTSFDGRVNVEQGLVHLQTVTVGGPVTASGTSYTDILDSTVSRDLSVADSPEGTAVCASEIDGAATFTGNENVQLGTGAGILDCEDGNYFGADVTVSDNTGGVDVSGNIVRGDLTGEDNDPAPTGSDNRVRGEAGGQFTDLEPAAQTMSAQAAPADHAEELDNQREERRASAEASAELAGPADLG